MKLTRKECKVVALLILHSSAAGTLTLAELKLEKRIHKYMAKKRKTK